MSNKRLAYEEKMDAQLKEWSAEIALLSAKADKAKAEEKKTNTTYPSRLWWPSTIQPAPSC